GLLGAVTSGFASLGGDGVPGFVSGTGWIAFPPRSGEGLVVVSVDGWGSNPFRLSPPTPPAFKATSPGSFTLPWTLAVRSRARLAFRKNSKAKQVSHPPW